jgi:hypothetical protein
MTYGLLRLWKTAKAIQSVVMPLSSVCFETSIVYDNFDNKLVVYLLGLI